jgi:hypothetical protein
MINSPVVRSGRFVCTECDANFLVWIDRIGGVKFKVGDLSKDVCPICGKGTWWRLSEITEVVVPPRIPPILFGS